MLYGPCNVNYGHKACSIAIEHVLCPLGGYVQCPIAIKHVLWITRLLGHPMIRPNLIAGGGGGEVVGEKGGVGDGGSVDRSLFLQTE